MLNFNIVTLLIILIFILPILGGIIRPFTKERIMYSIETLIDNMELIMGLVVSIYLTKMVYFEHDQYIFKYIYDWIPENIKIAFNGRDILVYLINVPIILFIILAIIKPIKMSVYKTMVEPISEKIFWGLNSKSKALKKFLGGLVQIPRSIFLVLVFCLIINFYNYYFAMPELTKWMNESLAYNILYDKALHPVLNSGIAKNIPVLLNDSFSEAEKDGNGEENNGRNLADRLVKRLAGKNITIIEYFNGVTLNEAIKSSPEIDAAAKKIVGNETDDYKKAHLLYKWIAKNITYDLDKAEIVSTDPKGISSGAVVAYTTRKGICFDYSSLYIAMCRATGVKVRLITGLGYSGVSWGDHAWNQVYDPTKDKWINVDTTFGTVANYFDRPGFNVDHKYDEIQGEW